MTEQMSVAEPSSRILKVGLFLPSGVAMQGGATAGWADLLALACRAEELGFDSLWLPDHVLLGASTDPTRIGAWECWSLLAALAASTSRVELGPLVSCTAYRNPAMLAKIADTVDEISGGRVVLGLGAGWAEAEFRAFDFPFDHRVSRFEEAIQIISRLLHRKPLDFHGTYHAVRDGELLPPGPRPQGPPIMVGTNGPRMLRLTARYADAWNADFGSTPESIGSLNEAVDAACRDVGRDPGTLARSASLQIDMPGHSKPGDHWVADTRVGRALRIVRRTGGGPRGLRGGGYQPCAGVARSQHDRRGRGVCARARPAAGRVGAPPFSVPAPSAPAVSDAPSIAV